jgi:periplasmic protein TonB
MKYWQSIGISLIIHSAIFCIPLTADIEKEHPKEDVQWIVMEEPAPEPKLTETPLVSQETKAIRETVPAPAEPEKPVISQHTEKTVKKIRIKEEPLQSRGFVTRKTEAVHKKNPPKPVVRQPKESVKEIRPEKLPEPESKPSDKPVQTPEPEPRRAENVMPSAGAEASDVSQKNDAVQNARQISSALSEQNVRQASAAKVEEKTAKPLTAARGPLETQFGAANGPRFMRQVMPEYPRLARRLQKQGTVLLQITIDELGRPVSVEILEKAGFGLDEAAVSSVKSSVFTPAEKDGRPVLCKAILPIRFELR